VEFDEAVSLAKKLGLAAVFETSAKKNLNIQEVFFRTLVNCIDLQIHQGNDSENSCGKKRKESFSEQGGS
jgi:hypothetical protein